jgi:hypothetical protein
MPMGGRRLRLPSSQEFQRRHQRQRVLPAVIKQSFPQMFTLGVIPSSSYQRLPRPDQPPRHPPPSSPRSSSPAPAQAAHNFSEYDPGECGLWDLLARDTMANGARSAAVVKKREELRDSVVEAHPAQTAKAEVVRHKLNEEFEILDL